MRRLLAALAALLIASSAHAGKVMVWVDEAAFSGLSDPAPRMTVANEKRQLRDVERLLRRLKVDYRVIPSKQMKTEFSRRGAMTWGFGTDGAHAEQFDAVIVVAFNGRAASASGVAVRGDSLTLSNPAAANGGLPTVPHLFLLNADCQAIAPGSAAFLDGTATQRDTLGLSGFCGAGECSGSHESERCLYMPGYPEAWYQTTFTATGVKNSTPPAGGIRTLLSARSNPQFLRYYWSFTFASDLDSIGRSSTQSNADSVVVWERPMAHVSGAATQVYAIWNTDNSTTTDTTETAEYDKGIGGDAQVLAFAINRLDSLAGGALLNGRQIDLAAVIRGAGGQSARPHFTGLVRADSARYKAAGDSTSKLGIPITVAIDPDSATAQEISWWRRFGQVKFTPYVRSGLDSTADGNACANDTIPRDVHGRYRNRSAYSPRAGALRDTSSFALLSYARTNLAAKVRSNELSQVLVPPDGDWTPYNVRRNQNADKIDSLFWAFDSCGYRGLVFDAILPVQEQRGTIDGWPLSQGYYGTKSWPSGSGRRNFLLLGHNGYRIGGSQFAIVPGSAGADSTTPTGAPWADNMGSSLAPFWRGVIGGGRDEGMNGRVQGTTNTEARNAAFSLYDTQRASVLMLGASEFGGTTGLKYSPPHPGYWQLKHAVHATRAINRVGWRPMFEWVWPENVRP